MNTGSAMRKRQLAIIVSVITIAIIGLGVWLTIQQKNKIDALKQQVVARNEAKTFRASENGIEFLVNSTDITTTNRLYNTKTNEERKPNDNEHFVTVRVQVKNTTKEVKSLYAMNQQLIGDSGKNYRGDAGLQLYIEDGSWYSKIPAEGSASGVFVFSLPKDEKINRLMLHSALGTDGVSMSIDT